MTVVQIRGKSMGRRFKVTTGRKAFVEIGDGRSPWARRWSDLIFAHASDLGGPETLSEAQISICRRVERLGELARRIERLGQALDANQLEQSTQTARKPGINAGGRHHQQDRGAHVSS